VVDDDLTLLESWRHGDNDAGDALVARHFEAVCRFFRSKLGDDVQDLIQTTFLQCVESKDRLALRPGGFRAFVFAIARNRLVDELRRRNRAPRFDPASQSLEDVCLRPSELAVADEEERAFRQALSTIALDHQIALELFYWERLSGREIADVLGISEHTVRSRLARAKACLRERLEALAGPGRLK
jgi:RNA polymerase sigma-70 factor (ECF subfamily)